MGLQKAATTFKAGNLKTSGAEIFLRFMPRNTLWQFRSRLPEGPAGMWYDRL